MWYTEIWHDSTEGIYDKFLERFKEYTSKTKVGDPFRYGSYMQWM